MEHTLRQLFDLSRFVSVPELDTVITDTLRRYDSKRVELFDESAELVSAAGDVGLQGAGLPSGAGKAAASGWSTAAVPGTSAADALTPFSAGKEI